MSLVVLFSLKINNFKRIIKTLFFVRNMYECNVYMPRKDILIRQSSKYICKFKFAGIFVNIYVFNNIKICK